MTKKEFLAQLKRQLSGIPAADAEASVAYYSEMIDDRMEEGFTEEEAVAAAGDPARIAANILAEMAASPAARPAVKERRRLRWWEVTLLGLGFPVWFSLLVAVAAVVFSLWVALWSGVIALYATAFTLGVSAIGCILASFFMVEGAGVGLVVWGAALVCAGLGVLFFILSNLAAKGLIALTRVTWKGLKRGFSGKE